MLECPRPSMTSWSVRMRYDRARSSSSSGSRGPPVVGLPCPHRVAAPTTRAITPLISLSCIVFVIDVLQLGARPAPLYPPLLRKSRFLGDRRGAGVERKGAVILTDDRV